MASSAALALDPVLPSSAVLIPLNRKCSACAVLLDSLQAFGG